MKFLIYPEIPEGRFDLGCFFAPNGAGHLKRGIGGLDKVLQAKPDTRVLVFTDQKMTERFMRDFGPLQRVAANPNVTFVFGVVSPGMDIMEKDETVYTDRRWFTWLEDRASHYIEALKDALVWLDALPLGLKYWPDAICSSSFTFGPVILERWGGRDDELGKVAREYAAEEESLMKKYLPTYVTVGLLSMPFMDERARVKKVGVMADFEPLPNQTNSCHHPIIGVRGGLTGLAGKVLEETTRLLVESGHYEVRIDKALSEKFPDLPVLGFGAEDYAPLLFNVCRPGAGEVTNSVTASVPIIAISEPGNMEMEWNGKSIDDNGLGFQVHSPEEAVKLIGQCSISEEWFEFYGAARAKIGINGLQELADEILERI